MTPKKAFFTCLFLSITLWIGAFSYGFRNNSESHMKKSEKNNKTEKISTHSIVANYLKKGDNFSIFKLIFTNNLKCCIINTAGASLLCIPTVYNSLYCGFVIGCQIADIVNDKTHSRERLTKVLPHSFEVVGLWLSGANGFFLLYIMFWILKKNERFTNKGLKLIGYSMASSVFIILFAAIIEAFISIKL